MYEHDVIVVGAGTAGLSLAILLANEDINVALVERKPKDLIGDKICGDAIAGHHYSATSGIPKPLGDALRLKVSGIKIYSPDMKHFITIISSEGGYIIDRLKYGQQLLNTFIDKGGTLYDSVQAINLIIEDGYARGIIARKLSSNELIKLKGKIIVDATGYQAQLLKKAPERWRIEKHIDKRDLIIAYREIIHVRNPLWDVENLHLHFIDRYAPGGYVWIFPWSKDGLYLNIGNGGMACYKTPHFRELLNNYASKVLPNLLADRSIIKSGIWLIPNRRPRHVFVGDGFLAVGDSAIMINPATSEGIGYGLYGAYLASKVIIEALEEDDFSQESLWRYQHAYMTSPYGVRQARLDVLRILMQAHGDDDFQYVIKYKILSSGDLTKARNEDEFMSKLSKFIKAGRMILSRRIKLFKNMKYALDMMKVVRKLYEEYPNTPEGIDDWIRREELIFNEVKDKLKPYNSYPVIC